MTSEITHDNKNTSQNIGVVPVNSNLYLQILFFLNVYLVPVWFLSTIYYLWTQPNIITTIELILTIMAIVVGTPAECYRLYFGYCGNLKNKISDFAGFWILSTFIQMPIQTYLLFTNHTIASYICLSVQSVTISLLVCEILIGFFAIRTLSKYRAEQFHLENVIRKSKQANG